MKDAHCELLVKNLPRLTFLNLSRSLTNTGHNNMSNSAAYSILRLSELEELNISSNGIGDKAA